MAAAPVLAEVTRSGRVESIHRGAIAVADARGRLVAQLGDVGLGAYFRSAAKPIQLLPLVESGAADRLGLGPRELAVAAASHSGSPAQVAAVETVLGRAGLDAAALACGYQEPRNRQNLARTLAGNGTDRSPIYNNCSGKHAGMLALAASLGAPAAGYLEPHHPAQAKILARTRELAGLEPEAAHFGIDGCSAPTLHATLAQMAAAFARLAVAAEPAGSPAARIQAAMAAHPDMLGEPTSFNSVLAQVLGARLLAKLGAEGVFCVAIPSAGLGVALKIEDGAPRALGVVVMETLLQLGVVTSDELGPLAAHHRPVLKNWRETSIGELRPAFELSRQ
ncbi:MAG TPA: asparaginase [Candidatus Udaeobacter sp.]|nr:asparaginase [Candidatus Udaeobacter sp.]